VCDEIAIIHKGRILEQGAWEELRRRHTSRGRVVIQFRELRETYGDLVEQENGLSEVLLDPHRNTVTYTAEDYTETNPGVIARLAAAGAQIVSVEAERTSLEQAYLKLIGETD
jgi:ABC-type multidrug transport system ATPase subunit